MQILASHLAQMTILTFHNGRLLGSAGELIVDPDRLEVQALHCRLLKPIKGKPVLLMRDICEIGQDHILIGSEDDLVDAREVVRIEQLLNRPFRVLRKPVVTQSGHRLGIADDFTISSTTFQLQRLYVRRTILSSLTIGNTIIDRSQIIEVTPKRFVVREAVAKTKVMAAPVSARPLA